MRAGRGLTLHVRQFRCPDRACPQRVFAERLPAYLGPWARKTGRLVEQLTALGMRVGGRGDALRMITHGA